MNIDGNVEALNRYEKEVDKAEKQAEYEINLFRSGMDQYVDDLIDAFNTQCRISDFSRSELKSILLQGLEAQI